ncbi:MAG: xanthine dehydrogenase family protein molybdopterin-binding subunit [Pseudomonadota bacterium]
MQPFGKSQTVRRFEDTRFLTGRGRYVDDIAPAGALHAVFLRSPHAHADIRAIDLRAARTMPGVRAVLTCADLDAAGLSRGMTAELVDLPGGGQGARTERPFLARGRVRFVGEAVAVVVAGTPDAAKDAAEAIRVDYAARAAHLDAVPGGPAVHDEVPDNLAFDWSLGDLAAVEAALAASAHRVRLVVDQKRVFGNPMEPRTAFADWSGGRLHLCVSAQGVWAQREELALALGLPEADILVTTPDVGGGFGIKGAAYPEYIVLAQAARVTGRPVRWAAERTEAMLSDSAGRDLVAEAEMGFDADHRITAWKVGVRSNLGAYNAPFGQLIQSELFSKVFTGPYDIPAAALTVRGIYTNTTQTDAYRGAGRPEAILTIERVMDMAARRLGADPWELRRRNFVTRFPYRTVAGASYDVGDFPRVLSRVRAEADADGFAARRAASAAAGELRGLGICYYIESILGAAHEAAAIEFEVDGTLSLLVGTQSNGQGHETVYAQFLSDLTGIPADRIRVVQGDSDRIPTGGGTGGSRSVTVQSAATLAAVEAMVVAFAPFVADAMEVDADVVGFADGAFRAPGSNLVLTLAEAADRARRAGRGDLLRHRASARLRQRSFPNGAHVAEVAVDPATGQVRLVRYTVTDDFGTLVHPMLVEGQIHGGVAQGLGQVLTENGVYDRAGQLLAASFMDYAMPRADDLPWIAFTTEATPTPSNPLGMKGCGEAGTVGALAAISNAVLDALWPVGVRDVDMPCTPVRVWEWIEAARRTGAGMAGPS